MDLSFLDSNLIERWRSRRNERTDFKNRSKVLLLKSWCCLDNPGFSHHEALVHPPIEFYMTYFSMEFGTFIQRKLVTLSIAQFWTAVTWRSNAMEIKSMTIEKNSKVNGFFCIKRFEWSYGLSFRWSCSWFPSALLLQVTAVQNWAIDKVTNFWMKVPNSMLK